MSLVTLNVLAVIVETVKGVYTTFGAALLWFELASVLVFSVEYLLRVWSCVEAPRYAGAIVGRLRFMLSPMALVDLLAVLPSLLGLTGFDLRQLRALRLFRMARLAKVGRYWTVMRQFRRVFRSRQEELIMSAAVVVLLLVLTSSVMYMFENDAQPEAFSSIPAAMWWSVATLTTVGYGDVYPVTTAGRLLAAVSAVLGIGLFALPTGILGAALMEDFETRKAQPFECPHCHEKIDPTAMK